MKSSRTRNRRQIVSQTDESYSRVRPVFYRPPRRWHFFAALIGALALEAGAVAVASLHKTPEIPTEIGIVQEPPPAEGIVIDLPPEPSPPPDEAPPPPEPVEPNDFVLEDPTPPPRPQTAPKRPPRVTTQAAAARPGPASYTNARANMLAAPHPSYS